MARYEWGGPHDRPPQKQSLRDVDHNAIRSYLKYLVELRLNRQRGRCTPSVRALAKVIARQFNISTSGGLSKVIKDYLFFDDDHGWKVKWFDEDRSCLNISRK